MRYQELDVYQRSYRLAVEIHKWSLGLPKELQFDLGSQIRRASRSIPSNIAEGLGKQMSSKDKVKFLTISLGSNDEMLFNLNFLKDIDLMKMKEFDYFFAEFTICGKQLNRLISSILSTSH